MGRLTANGSGGCAGIGSDSLDAYMKINIYGGNVTAKGGEWGAGIGTGYAAESSLSHNNKKACDGITITGGIITATGGGSGAGIGTGFAHNSNYCNNIIITGGSIKATGQRNAAGIGTGGIINWDDAKCNGITITGGSIIATTPSVLDIDTIGHGYGSTCGPVTYGDGITHGRKGNSEWVNLTYIDGKAASCEASGYKEAYYVPNIEKYYTAFPYTEDDLIGGENEYNIWKAEGGDGYIAPLGHSYAWKETKFHTCTEEGVESYTCKRCGNVTETRAIPKEHNYSYTGSYDTATEIYTLKKVCSACHEEAQEKALTYSVPKESYRSYLDVTNKAYINTEYKPTSDTHAVMDVKVNGAVEYWFGMWNENYNIGAFALGNDGGNVYVGYGNDGGGCGNSAVSNGRHTVELNKDIAYIDGNALAGLFKPSDAFTLDYPLYLFAQNRNGTEAFIPDNQKVTCYGFQILENDTLLHYYIPYVKDGVSGLFDLVDGEFFRNSNTTGTMKADGYVISIEGKGTEDEPYIIDSIEKLNLFKNYVNSGESYEGKYIKLTADIETPLTQSIGVWNDKPFKGIFDGDGHSITFTNTENTGNKGLFGYTVGAKISNLKVYGNVEGNWTLGGIVGCAKNTEIINCENHAAISWNENGNESYAGGIVGVSEGGNVISGCKNHGSISGNHCVGGILGEARENDIIKNCVNSAPVSGNGDNVGGIVGNGKNDDTVLNCINEGDVSGRSYIGGIVGSTVSDENGNVLVANCINYGKITATADNAGGIAGNMSYCGTVKNCFTAAEVNGAGSSGIVVGWANRSFSLENCFYQILDANSGMEAVKNMNSQFPTTGVNSANNADMITAMNRYIAENAENTADWQYCTVKDNKTWLTDDMSQVENVLSLKLNGNGFIVNAIGKDAGSGTVVVALYDNEYLTRLLDVKVFDLTKGENPQDSFTQSGYVRAMWWSDLDDITPLCGAVGKNMEITAQ